MPLDRIQPKKSLGQNFLQDKNILRKITDVIAGNQGETLIEIGPGPGALTEFLLETELKYHGVEIDDRAIEALYSHFRESDYPDFKIHKGDIRKFSVEEMIPAEILDTEKIKVVGNIPYNISSDIFFWIFEQSRYISKTVLMVQKEVAQRLCAQPRTKAYGILSVAADLIGSATIKFDVPPGCFFPKPRVVSAIIEIVFDKQQIDIADFKSIMQLVKASFSQRRKKIRNSSAQYIKEYYTLPPSEIQGKAEESGLDYFTKRAEELSTEDYIKFYNFLRQFR